MKTEIKNLGGDVIHVIDGPLKGADLSGLDLRYADFKGMDVSRTNFSGADLRGADFSKANLHEADLTGADLRKLKMHDAIGNGKEIITIQNPTYTIVMTKHAIQIGCVNHTYDEWKSFTDVEIDHMDDGALEWWNRWKDVVFKFYEKYLGLEKEVIADGTFPLYRRSRETGIIVRFDDESTGEVVMSDGKYKTTFAPFDDMKHWEEVPTFEHEGVIYYDTQPVWAWDDCEKKRCVRFIDAENKCTFYSVKLERNGVKWNHYAPIKHIEDWMVAAWCELKI